jgi:hypothetical protein
MLAVVCVLSKAVSQNLSLWPGLSHTVVAWNSGMQSWELRASRAETMAKSFWKLEKGREEYPRRVLRTWVLNSQRKRYKWPMNTRRSVQIPWL